MTFVDVQLPNTARGDEASTFCSCNRRKAPRGRNDRVVAPSSGPRNPERGDVLIPHC